ncbi:MAG: hypothetical protein WB676_17995 [Bryobacteraceae bacterium]
MRAKKALKQLTKAEALINTVADRYTPSDPRFKELLNSAEATVGQAKKVLDGRSGQASRTSAQTTKKGSQPQEPETAVTPEFTGNKTDFVRAVVEAHGTSGAAPREIDQAFTTRGIGRSKNLIYSALGALVRQKKLKKKGDRYLSVSVDSSVKSVPQKKRISPEGLKRIIEANKRRWAKKRAAEGAVRPRAIGKNVSAKRAAARNRA